MSEAAQPVGMFTGWGESTGSPGKTGIGMSFVVLIVGFIVAIVTQHYAADYINLKSWTVGCPNGYDDQCKESSAVLRVSFAMAILFTCQIIGSAIFARFFDVLWIIKVVVFGCLVFGFFFADADVFDLSGYAWFARIMGFFFLILQQIILLDLAYTWNEKWLAYATEEGEEVGQKWLIGIIVFSFLLFAGSITVIGLLYWQFDGCTDNNVIISLTLCLSFIATIIQLFFSDQGSILTSAIMTAYATYVCYSAVTLNPDNSCNPTLNSGYQTISTVIGLCLTVISLIWTTYTTVQTIPVGTNKQTGTQLNLASVVTGGAIGGAGVEGGTVNHADVNATYGATTTTEGSGGVGYEAEGMKSLFVQVSLVFFLISGYFAMILTNWATLQSNSTIANPKTGAAAMWIQAAGQWVAIVIYLWSLIAPKLFPDREF